MALMKKIIFQVRALKLIEMYLITQCLRITLNSNFETGFVQLGTISNPLIFVHFQNTAREKWRCVVSKGSD